MKSSLKICTLGGTAFYIHWTFIPLFAWVIIVNFAMGFTVQGVIWSFVLFCSLFFSILIHEMAHFIVAHYFNMQATVVVLIPFGEVSDLNIKKTFKYKFILVSLAGPVSNLLIGMLLLAFIHPYYAFWAEPGNIGFVDGSNFIFQLQIINFSIGLFNLIPVYPMDGGRIAKLLLSAEVSIQKASRIEMFFSLLVALILVIIGVTKIQPLLFLLGLFIILTLRLDNKLSRMLNKANEVVHADLFSKITYKVDKISHVSQK